MRLLQPLFALFASATDSHLAKMVEYLKAENKILQNKLRKRLTITPRERNRLVKLGSAIRDLITIVTPRAFGGWPPTGARRVLLLDHDTKFTDSFDAVFEADDTEVKRVGPVSPNLNAYAERWVQSARTECLDHFLILGEGHLRHVITEYARHDNEELPHQARGNVPLPVAQADDEGEPRILPFPSGEVKCRERLGGLLRHFYRAAA